MRCPLHKWLHGHMIEQHHYIEDEKGYRTTGEPTFYCSRCGLIHTVGSLLVDFNIKVKR